MLPIGDDNTGRTGFPFINYLLITINILVFIFAEDMGNNIDFVMSYSTVPAEILTNTDITTNGLGITSIPVYGTIFTSMFMHANLAHIGGNMLYLWIFGDNLESAMGHIKYLIFYLICGVLASLSHVFMSNFLHSGLYVPSLGASGAIAGVLGGYLILFPKNQVRVFAIRAIVRVPAIVALGIWIVLQIVSQLGALGGQESGGVAYAAHIGGFVAGMILVKFFAVK